MKQLLLLSLIVTALSANAQTGFTGIVLNQETKEALPGATVLIKKWKLSAVANAQGIVFLNNIPDGKQDIEISFAGFKESEITISFPITAADTIQLFLEPEGATLEEIKVSSTRSARSIKNTPTRVEILAEEEIQEEAAMRPGDIRMLLAESTGIQSQQTSATSASASIRIQGLDGRYTQILKDGFPVYSGAASGLGVLQTPPLDLRQVEIIKGASSTLYGGGAIAGLINLITKLPAEKREFNVNLNVTSAGGVDISSFFGKKFKKTGIAVFASRNSNKAYDPAGISFSAFPKFERYTLNPKLFLFLAEKTTVSFGINTTFENRLGGDLFYIAGKGDSIHSYFEKNVTERISTQLSIDHRLNDKNKISFKNSVGYFNRVISSNGYIFNGTQYSSFSEATVVHNNKKSDWVAGLNLLTDRFTEKPNTIFTLRNYNQNTIGAFVQNTTNFTDWLTVETGLRADKVNEYGAVLLPRISALFKVLPRLTTRIGGGFGYKAPTIFTEESEKILYQNVMPVTPEANKLEKSYGANWDINYKTKIGNVSFSVNQFFFYTYLKSPLLLQPGSNGSYRFINIEGNTNTKGAETNIKLGYKPFSTYLGYTYIDALTVNKGISAENALTPRHRFNTAIVYEVEDKLRIGSEIYYFSKQRLNDGNTGRDYWLTGLVGERFWKKFSLYINFENFGDVRQTKYENIYTGTVTNPVFKDIYAPVEGFVVNGGIKIKL